MTTGAMSVRINGETARVRARDLAALLDERAYSGDWLATAVNGELVRRDDRAGFRLSDGDRIEILAPMHGG